MLGRWRLTIDTSAKLDNPKADSFAFIEAPNGRKIWLSTNPDIEELALAETLVEQANAFRGRTK